MHYAVVWSAMARESIYIWGMGMDGIDRFCQFRSQNPVSCRDFHEVINLYNNNIAPSKNEMPLPKITLHRHPVCILKKMMAAS